MRRRFVLVAGDLVEIESANTPLPPDSGALWGDRSYHGLRATDGTDISTRSKHRQYMRERGLTTMDDFEQQWARDALERSERMRGVDPSRKQDIADVVYGRRPISKAWRDRHG